MQPKANLTIRGLAAQLGLSKATVSMALRNHPRISSETRAKVRERAAKLGYRPSALVNALMAQVRARRVKGGGECLAFFTAFHTDNEWRRLTPFTGIFEGARLRAEELGFRLDPYWLGLKGKDSQKIARILWTRAVRGGIFAPLPLDLEPLTMHWDEQLFVTTTYSFQQRPLHRVTHFHFNIMLECYRRLRETGHHRIGLAIPFESDERVRHFWRAGFIVGQQIHGGNNLVPLWFNDWRDSRQAREQFLCWHEKVSPDAVIGILPDYPLSWMRSAGIGVPETTSYVSLDLDHSKIGEISGIRQNVEAVGAAAVDVLVGAINRNEFGLPAHPKTTLLDGAWHGGSTMKQAGSLR